MARPRMTSPGPGLPASVRGLLTMCSVLAVLALLTVGGIAFVERGP